MSSSPTKKLVIYYSLEGNTKLMAETMAKAIDADILAIAPQKEISSKGFSKYFWGGSQVMMKRKPTLMPLSLNPLDYDLIIIGTPVWAWTYSPPIATLLEEVDFSGKQMALFSCHGGQNGKTFLHMKAHLPDSQVLDTIDFFEPLKNHTEECIQRALDWARHLSQ
ncbi:flavodoxin family protein [Anoxynatronum buryatiense]|uniref:Flavodoxin n=1 Tax=Anoxynatronum buryatiense TaxID=489973 RepID=A0AA45WT64_9CLOT|nr:flavodoxin [Anoxynatronum buryatiense]SMP40826.1 Flavodoxin [Anoxynatronum buryatiense]